MKNIQKQTIWVLEQDINTQMAFAENFENDYDLYFFASLDELRQYMTVNKKKPVLLIADISNCSDALFSLPLAGKKLAVAKPGVTQHRMCEAHLWSDETLFTPFSCSQLRASIERLLSESSEFENVSFIRPLQPTDSMPLGAH